MRKRVLSAVQISTGFSNHMTFAQRVENVITYAVVGLIDWVAFHRCVVLPCDCSIVKCSVCFLIAGLPF